MYWVGFGLGSEAWEEVGDIGGGGRVKLGNRCKEIGSLHAVSSAARGVGSGVSKHLNAALREWSPRASGSAWRRHKPARAAACCSTLPCAARLSHKAVLAGRVGLVSGQKASFSAMSASIRWRSLCRRAQAGCGCSEHRSPLLKGSRSAACDCGRAPRHESPPRHAWHASVRGAFVPAFEQNSRFFSLSMCLRL